MAYCKTEKKLGPGKGDLNAEQNQGLAGGSRSDAAKACGCAEHYAEKIQLFGNRSTTADR